MDFTVKIYRQLLESLQNAGFSFLTFEEYLESEKLKVKSEKQGSEKLKVKSEKFIILRHDVDLLPQNSLDFARIQHDMGIKGSYYFRAVPESWDEAIIKEIHRLGHEVGYHYEDVDLVKLEAGSWKSERSGDPARAGLEGRGSTQQNGNQTIQQSNHPTINNEALIDAAIISFQRNLEKLRQLVPVKTICMHGSPRSKYDNRDLWKKYDYRDFGIIGEPYYDVDFDDVFYLTDTGRRWDGWKVSVRDKVVQQERWVRQGLVFGSTREIIKKVKSEKLKVNSEKLEEKSSKLEAGSRSEAEIPLVRGWKQRGILDHEFEPQPQPLSQPQPQPRSQPFPTKIMMTFHPQRWTDSLVPWARELVMQNAKNLVKGALVRWQKK